MRDWAKLFEVDEAHDKLQADSEVHAKTRYGLALAWLACLATLVLRKPDTLLHAQFFAEDGSEWFSDAYNGDGSPLKPYASYLHLIPRSVAWLADALPCAYIPLAYNVTALALSSLACAWFALPHFRHVVRDDRLRICVCLLCAAWPGAFEILGSLTNLQWYLGCWAMLVCFMRWPRSAARCAALACAYFVVLLSAPTLLALAPVLAIRLLFDARARPYLCGLLAATIAYALYLSSNDASQRLSPEIGDEVSAIFLTVAVRVFGVAFIGVDELLDLEIGRNGAVALGVAAILAIAALLFLLRKKTRVLVLSSGFAACACAASLLFVHVRLLGHPEHALAWEERVYRVTWCLRFGALPSFALYVVSAMVLEQLRAFAGRPRARIAALVLLFGFAAVDNFRELWEMKRLDWKAHANRYDEARRSGRPVDFDAQINPMFRDPKLRWAPHTSLLDRVTRNLGADSTRRVEVETPFGLSFVPPKYWRRIRIGVGGEIGGRKLRFRILVDGGDGTRRVLADSEIDPGGTAQEVRAELGANCKMLQLEATSDEAKTGFYFEAIR